VQWVRHVTRMGIDKEENRFLEEISLEGPLGEYLEGEG
jgi:hypothetical protein